MKCPWQRSEAEKIDAAVRIVEAERDLREARVARAGVERLGIRVDELRQALQGGTPGAGRRLTAGDHH